MIEIYLTRAGDGNLTNERSLDAYACIKSDTTELDRRKDKEVGQHTETNKATPNTHEAMIGTKINNVQLYGRT
jgi:hypothetical protein